MKGSPFFQCDTNLVSYHGNRVILIATQKKKYECGRKRTGFCYRFNHADLRGNSVQFYSLGEMEGSIIFPDFQKKYSAYFQKMAILDLFKHVQGFIISSRLQRSISRSACFMKVKVLFHRGYCQFQRQNTLVAIFL